jgi:hypothetical protein
MRSMLPVMPTAAPLRRGSPAQQFRTLAKSITLGEPRGVSEQTLRTAERRLGQTLPRVVTDFYSTVGRLPLTTVFQRLMSPREMEIDRGRLVFLDENQGVVQWGVPLIHKEPDPPIDARPGDRWFREHRSCVEFLGVILCYNAVSGGMPHIGSFPPNTSAVRRLNAGWMSVGRANVLRAWVRPGRVACIMKEGDHHVVYAGAHSAADLRDILEELGRPGGIEPNALSGTMPEPGSRKTEAKGKV